MTSVMYSLSVLETVFVLVTSQLHWEGAGLETEQPEDLEYFLHKI